MGSAIFNTIRIPLIALVLVVLFATFISYLAVRKRNVFTNLIDSLSMVPYIVPGTVLGIASFLPSIPVYLEVDFL